MSLDWFEVAQHAGDVNYVNSLRSAFGNEMPELILCADVVWVSDLVAPLASTLDILSKPAIFDSSRTVPVLMAIYERSRGIEDRFFDLLRSSGFSIEILEINPFDARMRIFKFSKGCGPLS